MAQDSPKKLLKTEALAGALRALLSSHSVYAPAGEAERQAFTKLSPDNLRDVNLKGLPTLSPKEIVFPRSETLFGVSLESGEAFQPASEGPIVLFGVRPCDARGISNLDQVFLDEEYTDTAYNERRKMMTVISLACAEPVSAACFCDSMGGGPDDEEGSDIIFRETKNADVYVISILTEKGKEIESIWESTGLLSPAGNKKPVDPQPCTLTVAKPSDLSEKLKAAFEDPLWARFSEACLGCGVCSFICPTCYCFDIDAETSGDMANSFRCWDCCLFSDYSRMAGGHNPRPTKKERLRQRYLHKLSWFDERYGRTLCVGCGRCLSKCPTGLDIVSVIEWGGAL